MPKKRYLCRVIITIVVMKRFYIVLLACAMTLCACSIRGGGLVENEPLATGDLLFVSLPLDYGLSLTPDSVEAMMQAVRDSGGATQCIHVAMLEVAGDSTFIIDATARRGVARYPLEDFLSDFTLNGGTLPVLQVMRLDEDADGERYVANAKRYIGRSYDFDFRLDNEAQYCSELVRNAYVTAAGDTLFALGVMDFGEGRGQLSRYWQDLAAVLHCTIPQDGCGILPYDILKDPRLRKVCVADTVWAAKR